MGDQMKKIYTHNKGANVYVGNQPFYKIGDHVKYAYVYRGKVEEYRTGILVQFDYDHWVTPPYGSRSSLNGKVNIERTDIDEFSINDTWPQYIVEKLDNTDYEII